MFYYPHFQLLIFFSSCSRVFCKKPFLKELTKLAGKDHRRGKFLTKTDSIAGAVNSAEFSYTFCFILKHLRHQVIQKCDQQERNKKMDVLDYIKDKKICSSCIFFSSFSLRNTGNLLDVREIVGTNQLSL